MSKTTLEMAPSFEGLPERQVQSCGLDEEISKEAALEQFRYMFLEISPSLSKVL